MGIAGADPSPAGRTAERGDRREPGVSRLPGQPSAAHPDDERTRAGKPGTKAPEPVVRIFPTRAARLRYETALVAEISKGREIGPRYLSQEDVHQDRTVMTNHARAAE